MFDDPRIAREAQSNQTLYSNQRPRRIFDRGHLVRRQDPAWGTPARAKRANADTFHFTNCSPQESRFNQQSRYWQGIENYVLDNSEDFDDTARIEEYQTTVAEIERLTGLDFGDLRNHDTFQPGPEEALSPRRSLASFDDISLDAAPPRDDSPGNGETLRQPAPGRSPRRRT